MNNNNDNRLIAKQLYECGKLNEAKELILEIISKDNGNNKLLTKLGDICIELKEYENAQKYYQLSIENNPWNPSIYIKIGNLYQEYLSNYDEAKRMYLKCIELDIKNEECWFNAGKLYHKLNEYKQSEKCYLKCKTERACINYQYALLLMDDNNNNNMNNNKQKSLNLLYKATKLKPNITKYHHQYAVCLIDNSLYFEAKKSFERALKLSKNKDLIILYDFANFVSKYLNDHQSAIYYLEIAIKLDPNKKYPFIHEKYRNLEKLIIDKDGKKENIGKIKYDPFIKLLIYNFDENITYWNIYKYINNDINELYKMSFSDIDKYIFGGKDRINRLKTHFLRILSSKNNIKLAIISSNHTNIIIKALKRARLYRYFVNCDIIGTEKHKLYHIIELTKKYNLNISTNTLFIDSNLKNIESACNHCKTYHVFSDYTLNGLSLKHMDEIETILGVQSYSVHNESFKNTNIDLFSIDRGVYRGIKRESSNVYDSLDTLPVIQWIYKNWDNHPHKNDFILFATKYQYALQCQFNKNMWMRANILPQLIAVSPNDYKLQGRFARCLDYLGHTKEAEYYHKLTTINVKNGCLYYQYGAFLYRLERYFESEQYYQKAVEYIDDVRHKYLLYSTYAQTLAFLEQPKKAEYYFKLSLQQNAKGLSEQVLYCVYGKFLCQQQRYNESVAIFETALNIDPKSALNHHGLSRTLYKMGSMNDFQYHLNRSLELNPYLKDANNDWNKYIVDNNNDNKYIEEFKENELNHNGSDDKKTNYEEMKISSVKTTVLSENEGINNCYFIEFDRFWFDGIGIINKEFNKYYDNFLNNDMNDIRVVLFDDNLDTKLRNIIGVESLQNLQAIMTNIQDLKDEHKAFVNMLKKRKIFEYYPIFANCGIFWMESFEFHIKSEQDIKRIFKLYNDCNQRNTKQFDINNDNIVKIYHLMTKSATNCNNKQSFI